jgi:triphosphoribosyl-dephospho-CoA synthase
MLANMSEAETSLAQDFKSACLAEIEALKPGNVHIFSDGHGMRVQDFIRSAEAASSVIAAPDSAVGERILSAIKATSQAVSCNTNLGIVLLCAPIIQAAFLDERASLSGRIDSVLKQLTLQDAVNTFDAIKIASPAGLGQSPQHDVHQPPDCTLLEAMQAAADRDLVARQYADGFQEIWLGLAHYQTLLQRWQRPAWATTGLYLHFLAAYPDSHIVRKYGIQVAENIRTQALEQENIFLACDNPKTSLPRLLKWDTALKENAINPGTSADMTVAALLISAILNKTLINSAKPGSN